MDGQLNGAVKNQRMERLLEQGEIVAGRFFQERAEREEIRTVLFEQEEDGFLTGIQRKLH